MGMQRERAETKNFESVQPSAKRISLRCNAIFAFATIRTSPARSVQIDVPPADREFEVGHLNRDNCLPVANCPSCDSKL